MVFCISSRSSAVGVPPSAWRMPVEAVHGVDRGDGSARPARRCPVDDLAGADAGGAAKDHEVDQRVGAQAVRPVHGGAAGLAHGHQAGHDGVGVVLGRVQHLAPVVRGDAAHVVVHRRQNRDRLLGQVDTGEDAADSEMPGRRSASVSAAGGSGAGGCGPCSGRRRGLRGFPSSCSARPRRARRGPCRWARSAP
jgi:hypothetical protein